MAQLRPDSSLCEYSFSEQEIIQAKILTPLQVMWLQTKYALLFKEKASRLIPEDSGMDRSFLLMMGNIQGKLDMLQEIFDEAKEAQNQFQNITPEGATEVDGIIVDIVPLAERAAAQVHNEQD